MPRLLAAVKAVPAASLILYTRYTPENAESVVYTDEIARLMAEASAVPIYGTIDLYIGTGVVGGMMRGSRATGTRVGEMAQQILNGTRPEDIPIEAARLVPTFDWRQVQRWGIDPSRLPPGSDIQFRTPTVWESYRRYIVGTIGVVVAQLLLIAGLLTQRGQTASRRGHDPGEGGHASNELRTNSANGWTAHQRTGGGARGHRPRSARRCLPDSWCTCRWESTASRVRRATFRTRKRSRPLQSSNEIRSAVFDGIRRLSHDLHPAIVATAWPRSGPEGALPRSREAAQGRGELHDRGRSRTAAPRHRRLFLSNRSGVAPKRDRSWPCASDSRSRSPDLASTSS